MLIFETLDGIQWSMNFGCGLKIPGIRSWLKDFILEFWQEAFQPCLSQTGLQNTGMHFVTFYVAVISRSRGEFSAYKYLAMGLLLKEKFNVSGYASKFPSILRKNSVNMNHCSQWTSVLEDCQMRWLWTSAFGRNEQRCLLTLLSFNGAILGPGTPAHHPHTSGLNNSLTRLFSIKALCLRWIVGTVE